MASKRSKPTSEPTQPEAVKPRGPAAQEGTEHFEPVPGGVRSERAGSGNTLGDGSSNARARRIRKPGEGA